MKAHVDQLREMVVTLFEEDGKPFIRIELKADSGELATISTELDCTSFRVRFNDGHDHDPNAN